jgi:cell shape-determining protein MreC
VIGHLRFDGSEAGISRGSEAIQEGMLVEQVVQVSSEAWHG